MPSGGPLDPKQSSAVSNEIYCTLLYTNTKDFGLLRDRISNASQALYILSIQDFVILLIPIAPILKLKIY